MVENIICDHLFDYAELAWGEVIVMVLTSDSHLQPVLSGSGEGGGGGGGRDFPLSENYSWQTIRQPQLIIVNYSS